MTKQPFKNLPIGETFRFAMELCVGYQGTHGPWVKLSPRKYAPEDMGAEHRVASINIPTVPPWNQSLKAPLPLTGAPCSCRKGIERDNCPNCEGTGRAIDWRVFHRTKQAV